MAIVRRSAEITTDAYGHGEDQITAYPIVPARMTELYAVCIRDTAQASPAAVAANTSVQVSEVLVDSIATDEEDYGDILFFKSGAEEGVTYYPRKATVDLNGEALGTEGGGVRAKTREVVVEVDGAGASAAIVVDVYFKSSGDQRF